MTWFHVQWGTFGSWLPGDPSGFRNHQNRIRSSGDYKNPPPPGEHAGLHKYARAIMKGREVVLSAAVRQLARDAIVAKALELELRPLAVAVGQVHVHALLQLPPYDITAVVGKLKRHSSHAVRALAPGRTWSARCHWVLVEDRVHHRNVFEYILDHVREGASVWSFRDIADG